MKRTQLNLALAVVAVGLGAAVFFSQKKEPPKKPTLTALRAGAIDRIVIAHPGSPDIRLEKQAGSWKLTAPVTVDADPLEVNGILSLASLETRNTLDPKQVDKAELGLDPPAFTVSLNDVALQFGGIEPLKYQRYIETAGKIELVDDPSAAPLDADYSDLVSKALLPAGADIRKIEVPGLTVARSADGKGWETIPANVNATSDALQQFIDGWKSARALWVQPETGTVPGEAVTVTLKDRSISLLIEARDPQFVIDRPDLKLRYVFRKPDADKLLKLLEPKTGAASANQSDDTGNAATSGAAVPPVATGATPKTATR
jgi:hypothetical protein